MLRFARQALALIAVQSAKHERPVWRLDCAMAWRAERPAQEAGWAVLAFRRRQYPGRQIEAHFVRLECGQVKLNKFLKSHLIA